MRISACLGGNLDRSRHDAAANAPRPAEGQSQAQLPTVVPSAGRHRAGAPQRVRPAAALLAQLLAVAEDLPATRIRRRADPGPSIERYRAVSNFGPTQPRATTRMA